MQRACLQKSEMVQQETEKNGKNWKQEVSGTGVQCTAWRGRYREIRQIGIGAYAHISTNVDTLVRSPGVILSKNNTKHNNLPSYTK